MMGVVTDLSPECFESCPQLCQPLEGLLSDYLATQDTNTVKAGVCANTAPFACMFEASNIEPCGKVFSAGEGLVELPTSAADLQAQCSTFNLRGGGAQHHDVQSGNSSNDDSSDNTTDVQSGGSGDITNSAGQGGLLLGLLAPAALLFAA